MRQPSELDTYEQVCLALEDVIRGGWRLESHQVWPARYVVQLTHVARPTVRVLDSDWGHAVALAVCETDRFAEEVTL